MGGLAARDTQERQRRKGGYTGGLRLRHFRIRKCAHSDGVSVRAGEFGLSRMWQNSTSIRLLLDR